MSWVEKALQRHKMEKLVEEVTNTPEFKEKQRLLEERAINIAIARFSFFMCDFVETRHGYKAAGLKKVLHFIATMMGCTAEDENFFVDHDAYYKEEYGLDVLAELGMGLEDVQP